MPARLGNTYRAARHNHARITGYPCVRHTPPSRPAVEALLRAWLLRRHGVVNAGPKPPFQAGPSRHGKCIIATHLSIAKDKVREAKRKARTGISCEPGQTHRDAAHRRRKHDAWMLMMGAV